MTGLTLEHISKKYKKTGYTALRDINLQVGNDEFLVILGPSGSGKTTLLRIIAGLEPATEGNVMIDDQSINNREPQERGVGMVFQNYALFPHMTVQGNLSFPLKIPWQKRAERETEVNRIADILDIRRYLKFKPYMLSGGERQRVAMGRAMVNECRLYLFDEPLSNLDDTMRSKLRPEILRLFRQLHVPFLYVTHDQTDAMTMGTKIAVMQDGIIQQVGTPDTIYNHPVNMFVAGFLGSVKMNFIPVDVDTEQGKPVLKTGDVRLSHQNFVGRIEPYLGKQVILGIRPEDILTVPAAETAGSAIRAQAELQRYDYLGNTIYLYVDLDGHPLCVKASSSIRARRNQVIDIFLDCNKIHLFDPETELCL